MSRTIWDSRSESIRKSSSGMRSMKSMDAPAILHCWAYSANEGRIIRTLPPGTMKAAGKFLIISDEPAPMATLSMSRPK